MKYVIKIHRIPHPYYKHLVKIDNWCKENCLGDWQHGEKQFSNNFTAPDFTIYEFENPKDAVRFKLEWL